MTLPELTTAELVAEIGFRATVGSIVIVVVSAAAAIIGPTALTPTNVYAVRKYSTKGQHEAFLGCLMAAVEAEVGMYVAIYGTTPE